MKRKIAVSWSSGKDSAYMLGQLLQNPDDKICALVTSFNENYQRVAMHGVRESLVTQQAVEIAIPLWKIYLPDQCDNQTYAAIMAAQIKSLKEQGITHMAFGDLFLEDIRDYRVKQLQGSGIEPLFPLWQLPTAQLARVMIKHKFKAVITCVDSQQIPSHFVGGEYNEDFLLQLPNSADPCGENGEFHTFAFDAPYFKSAIPIQKGPLKTDPRFVYCDFMVPHT